MICRIWHGWTTPENADPYEQLLRSEIFAGIASRRIPGFLGIDLVRRPLETSVEFVTITGSVSGLENLVFASAAVLLSGTIFRSSAAPSVRYVRRCCHVSTCVAAIQTVARCFSTA
jgi:hypothetical protein